MAAGNAESTDGPASPGAASFVAPKRSPHLVANRCSQQRHALIAAASRGWRQAYSDSHRERWQRSAAMLPRFHQVQATSAFCARRHARNGAATFCVVAPSRRLPPPAASQRRWRAIARQRRQRLKFARAARAGGRGRAPPCAARLIVPVLIHRRCRAMPAIFREAALAQKKQAADERPRPNTERQFCPRSIIPPRLCGVLRVPMSCSTRPRHERECYGRSRVARKRRGERRGRRAGSLQDAQAARQQPPLRP